MDDTKKGGVLLHFPGRTHIDEELTRGGRRPLYVDRTEGRIRDGDPVATFGNRLARIRGSLEKINDLMAEVKRMSAAAEAEECSS